MTLALGGIERLAIALGLMDADGALVGDWFTRPGHYLASVLAADEQRAALLDFADDVLGGGENATDAAGRTWVPVVDVENRTFVAAVVVEEVGDEIHIGVGVRSALTTQSGVGVAAEAMVPLFATLREGGMGPVETVLLGGPGADVAIDLTLDLPDGAVNGGVALADVALGARIPTDGTDPSFRLALHGLRLPGATAPREIVIDADGADELDDAVLDLLLGLVRAAVADPDVAGPLSGLAGMLGLAEDDVPDFPIAELRTRGAAALADWLAEALSAPSARGDWLTSLATLLGGTVADDAVEVTILGAHVRAGVTVAPGTSALPRITPFLELSAAGAPGVSLALRAEPVSIDLGSRAAVALPALAATVRVRSAGPGRLLEGASAATMPIAIGSLEAGLGLDASRRPKLVLTAHDAVVGATEFDALDLSSPEALTDDVETVVGEAARTVLGRLGPAGDAVAVLVGFARPPGATAPLPQPVDVGALLADPLAAVTAYWRTLVTQHADDVPAVLTVLRGALASDAARAIDVSGVGTAAAPWRVPLTDGVALLAWRDGDRVAVSIELGLTSAEVAGSGLTMTLSAEAVLADLDLAARRASFLPSATGRLEITGPGGVPLTLGTTSVGASATALGLALGWAAGSGVSGVPVVRDARVILPGGATVAVPRLVRAADGSLALDAAGWEALQQVFGALAELAGSAAGVTWPAQLARLLGWLAPASGPLLPLADLVADPEAALRDYARAVLEVETATPALVDALDLLAGILGGPSGQLLGGGRPGAPWRLPFRAPATANEAGAAIIAALGPAGPEVPPTFVSGALRLWQPGDPGLDPSVLFGEIATEAGLDDALAQLVRGRGDVAAGMDELIERWAGTDGLVALPEGVLPAGVTAYRASDHPHAAPLGDLDLDDVLGAAPPATVVHIAVVAPGCPDVLRGGGLDGVPPERVIDLTGANRPPEAIAAAVAAPGAWIVRLGSRAECRLERTDPDGVEGQAARLRRALAPLAAAGAAVVAHGGAGHAAVRAAGGLPGLTALVTVGTPWSTVAVDALDRAPAAEALRLLAALLPAVGPDEPDDADLAVARSLVGTLVALDPLDDPLVELRPPGGLAAPAGLPVHAVVGSIATPAILRAATAVTAAALAARARERAAGAIAPPDVTTTGLSLPLVAPVPRGGLVAEVIADLELVGLPADPAAPRPGPALVIRTELSSASGWLVGGPDPGRSVGIPRPLALRRLSATVHIPLAPGDVRAKTTFVLHDATVFGVARTRWLVEAGPDAAAGATVLLPEIRALLGQVARRFAPTPGVPADSGLAALRDALTALGVLDADGGADHVTLERLLFDPAPTARAAIDDAARRRTLAAALRTLTGDTRPGATDSVRITAATAGDAATGLTAILDLAARSVTVEAEGHGMAPWAASVRLDPSGTANGFRAAGSARIGPRLPAPGAGSGGEPSIALLLSGAALDARLRVRLPGGTQDVALWPNPDAAAVAALLADVAPAALLHILLDTLRGSLTGSAPAAGAAVDALLDALGLLGTAPAADAARPTRLPVALLRDPAAWLASLPPGLVGAVPRVLDALRALLGAAGAAGTLEVADGVAIRATGEAGRLTLAVDLDAGAFAAPAGGPALVLGGSAGLAVGAGAAPLPDVSLRVGVAGVGELRLEVGAGVSVVLRPGGGAEIPLFPGGPGLGGVAAAAGAAATRALPPLLDAIAARDPATAPDEPVEVAGRLVARLGDALALRTGEAGSRRFDGAALSAFGHDPASALAARGAEFAAAGLTLVEQALAPALGTAATRSVSVGGGALVVTIGGLIVRWRPGTTRVEVTIAASGVPGITRLQASAAFDATGLQALDVALGPADLDLGPVTLRPYARVHAGAPAALVELGLGLDAAGSHRFAARFDPATGDYTLLAITNATTPSPSERIGRGDVAQALLQVVVELAGSVVLALTPVRTALVRPLLGTTAQALLTDVLLAPGPEVLPGVLDPATVPRRLATLLGKLAQAPGAAVTIDDALTLRAHRSESGGVSRLGLGLGLGLDRAFPLVTEGVTITLEDDDASWIRPPSGTAPPKGIVVTALAIEGTDVTFEPGLTVAGLGVRIGRSDGPLLDAGLQIDSIAVHVFADIDAGGPTPSLAGGARLELAGLAVPMAGAGGGDNAVAQGLLSSGGGGSGDEPPKPRFSPAVAVQKHPGEETLVTLSAGPGSGPWWLVVQRGFGPVYIEQVGLEVTMAERRIGSFGLLIDGKVSLLGLTAAVDDLSITYLVSSGLSPLDPEAWRADLAGFSVTGDMAGLTLAGGLRKFPVDADGVEYLGLLLARFGVYGISVYGGYGLVGRENDRFAALFLFGAVNGPIGGPPAFFVTGIGGGFGINRALKYPDDLSRFGDYPFIKALDPASRPGDPMAELEAVRGFFPARRGTFWFAAGLSFTSFALVDGVAVVAIQIGDGFEVTLLGLARMALPRPQAALVSIEIGLLARLSSREGLLLVQAQLTDNSWLLYPSVRLTGGFAFATWFKGPNKGQFVLTLGGYHPSFQRAGYPDVPRLGLSWQVNPAISIRGEAYFALTSEAVMAGARIEATARLGPAWASLEVGGDGIVFFDPFWLSVTVYARISAGVTIDVWIGEITIRVSLSARVTLDGPPFHGRASFSVGPVDLSVEFGDRPSQPREIPWEQFVVKYLEEASPSEAHVLAAVPGKGAIPPGGSASTGGAKSPDGSDARPFRVAPEFELTVTSAAPVRELVTEAGARDLPTVPEVSAAPMRRPAKPRVTLKITGPEGDPEDRMDRLIADPQKLGAFAIGTWGPAQSQDDPKVPSGDVLSAVDRILLRAEATVAQPTSGTAPAIRYRQVEIGERRRPLPFVVEDTPQRRDELTAGAAELAGFVPAVAAAGTIPVAAELLATRGGRLSADVAQWTGARSAPPLLGSLAEGLGGRVQRVDVEQVKPPAPPAPGKPRQPVFAALLGAPVAASLANGHDTLATTTVGDELRAKLADGGRLTVGKPPRMAAIDAALDAAAPARLLRIAEPAIDAKRTVLAAAAPPVTRTGRAGAEVVDGRGADAETAERLVHLGKELLGASVTLTDGDVAVLRLPDAALDVDPKLRPALDLREGRVRVVVLSPGGLLADDTVLVSTEQASLEIAPGARTVACLAGPPDEPVAGWVAGTAVVYAGDETWIGAGVTARSAGRIPERGLAGARVGWVAPDQLVARDSAVVTTFAAAATAVAVATEGGADADDLALGLSGARRPLGPDGRPAAPIVVTDGPRTVSVFAVEPEALSNRLAEPVTVTVSTVAGRHLVGVAGTTGLSPEQFVAAIAARGLPDVVPPVVRDGLRRHEISWKDD